MIYDTNQPEFVTTPGSACYGQLVTLPCFVLGGRPLLMFREQGKDGDVWRRVTGMVRRALRADHHRWREVPGMTVYEEGGAVIGYLTRADVQADEEGVK